MRQVGALVDDSVLTIDRRVKSWGATLVVVALAIIVWSAWAEGSSEIWGHAVALIGGAADRRLVPGCV